MGKRKFKTIEAAFRSRKLLAVGDCQQWPSAKPGEYGALWWNGQMWRAPRVAFELAHGPIPEGMLVCHTCDNPPCVLPAHLFLGTLADNHADMVAKGRRGIGPGEACPTAKLTAAKVRSIRAAHAAGKTLTSLAAKYGVTRPTIRLVVIGETWKSVTAAPKTKWGVVVKRGRKWQFISGNGGGVAWTSDRAEADRKAALIGGRVVEAARIAKGHRS